MNPSTTTGEDAVTDDQVAAETSQIKTAESLNTPIEPASDPAPERAAPEPEKKPEPPAPKSLADERREEMTRRSRARRDAEMAESGVKPPKPESLVAKPVSDGVESQYESNVNLPSNLRRRADGEFVVVQKVNGVEQEVLYSKLHADAQKVAAANVVFQEKAALQKKYDELQARLAQSASQPSTDAAGKAPSRKDEQQVISRDTLNKAFIEDDEPASQAILDRLNRNPQELDQGQVVEEATQSALFRIEQKAALAAVSMDPQYGAINAQILSDPSFSSIANNFSAQLQESEPDLDTAGNIAKALQMTRERLAAFAPPTIAPDALSARTAAKVAHTQANQPVGNTQRQPQTAQHTATPLSTRDRMRANRIAGNG